MVMLLALAQHALREASNDVGDAEAVADWLDEQRFAAHQRVYELRDDRDKYAASVIVCILTPFAHLATRRANA